MYELMRKIVRIIDPKLEKYREHRAVVPKQAPKYRPESVEEFVDLVKRTPKRVLSERDRARIAAVMSYDERRVGDLMTERAKMVFVRDDEVLGPLVLDKLYKSGFTSFPVVNAKERVVGVLHTEALNALEIRQTERADKYMNTQVGYLKASDTLARAVAEIKRTQIYYYLVQDDKNEIVGFFTVQMLLDYLLGN